MMHVFDVGLAAFLGAWPANIALKPHSLPMYVSQLTPNMDLLMHNTNAWQQLHNDLAKVVLCQIPRNCLEANRTFSNHTLPALAAVAAYRHGSYCELGIWSPFNIPAHT
jgi:hypothetical protein